MEWSEVDFENAVWRIPAEKMKMRNEHVVPLSRQALAILKEARALADPQSRLKPVFHGRRISPRI